jgi:hypothetical protein
MKVERTTIFVPDILKDRIDSHVKGRDESLTDFYTRAIVNQMENDGDFEVRDLMEVAHDSIKN